MRNDNWGSVARFGIFVVGAEVVPEAEWWAMAPPGVSIHAARVTAKPPWAQWTAGRKDVILSQDVERGAGQFAAMALAAVTIAHSSSSIAGGPGWDEAATMKLRELLHPGTAVTTNGDDCARALRHCGVTRPFVVFPAWFGEATMDAGVAYLAERGFAVSSAFRHVPEARWASVRPEDLYRELMHIAQNAELLFEQVVRNCPRDADGVLFVGTGVRCVGLIEPLEEKLGRPVITANQASMWRCLGLAGVDTPIAGYGQLLSEP